VVQQTGEILGFTPFLFCTPYLNGVFMTISVEVVPYVGVRISGDGLRFHGLIEFGMTADEVKEHFHGEPVYKTNYGGGSDSLMYRIEGLEFAFDQNGKLDCATCFASARAYLVYAKDCDDDYPENFYLFDRSLRDTINLYKRDVDSSAVEFQDGIVAIRNGFVLENPGWRDGRRNEPAGAMWAFSKPLSYSYDFLKPYACEAFGNEPA
jgi:hypothetical protein